MKLTYELGNTMGLKRFTQLVTENSQLLIGGTISFKNSEDQTLLIAEDGALIIALPGENLRIKGGIVTAGYKLSDSEARDIETSDEIWGSR